MFPGLKQDGKKPVPNAGTELGPGRGCSECSGLEISWIFWEKSGSRPGNGIRERRPLKKRET